MAHAATLKSLGESLITHITGKTHESPGWRKLVEQTARVLRDRTHVRTNQFEVKSRLDGLVEKFSVLNREDLADALQTRLEELSIESQWLPEVLSLLLELSDRPAKKTDISVLERFHEVSTVDQDSLWSRILASSAHNEDELWENVERGYHSSGDESLHDDAGSEPTVSTQATSLDHVDIDLLATQQVQVPEDPIVNLLRAKRQAERATRDDETKLVNELQFVREMLTVLRGQATYCFATTGLDSKVAADSSVRFADTSRDVVFHISSRAADLGTGLNFLRHWTQLPQSSPHLRAVQSAVRDALTNLNRSIGEIEQRFVSDKAEVVVSSVHVLAEALELGTPFVHLSKVLKAASHASQTGDAFRLMDSLYDAACTTSLTGESRTFRLLSDVFLAGLKIYLRIVAEWVLSASTSGAPAAEVFVSISDPPNGLGSMWRQKFSLKRQRDDMPCAPKCMHPLIDTIFASGKSNFLLRQLRDEGQDGPETASKTSLDRMILGLQTNLRSADFILFAQSLDEALTAWVFELASGPQLQVHTVLLHERGLSEALSALPYVFFGKNGSLYHAFAEAVIQRVSSGATVSGHGLLETAMARTSLGLASHVEPSSLSFSITESHRTNDTTITRRLVDCRLGYSFTWPVQNITGCRSSSTHARAHVLLLQVHHAKTLLTDMESLSTERPGHSVLLQLRQRLLWLVGLFHYHFVAVVSDCHAKMMRDMSGAGSIDAMIGIWDSYDKDLQITLLLTPSLAPVRDALVSVLELSERCGHVRGEHGIKGLFAQFDKHLAFFRAGVRGVSRAGSNFWLEALADRLDWCNNS